MSNLDFSNVPIKPSYKPVSFISAADKPSMILNEQYIRATGYLGTLNAMVENPADAPGSHTFQTPADLPAGKVADYNTRMRAIRDAFATISFNYREIMDDCGVTQ